MPRVLWRTDEIVVLVYFQSRKVCHEACRKLIQRKCATQRDLAGIRGKLAHIRGRFSELWDSELQQWNLEAVDQWLSEQDTANFADLTNFDSADQQLVLEVSLRQRSL